MVKLARRLFDARVLAAALALGMPLASGCASMEQSLRRDFTPQAKDGAHIFAFQAASFGYAFLDGHMLEWESRLAALEDDYPPLLDAAAQSGWRIDYEVVPHPPKPNGPTYEWYGVNLVLSRKGARFVIPGEEGMSTVDYVRALAPASKATKIPAEVLRRGHFALYALVTMSGSLNATDEAMRRQAFGLLVVRERLSRKDPQADTLMAIRPPEQAKEDVEVALAVVADHHDATQRFRAEALALIALARDADVAEARRALAAQVAESRARAHQWRVSHKRPTMEDFGVGMREMKLPTPDNMLAALDKDGYIAAAVTIARGVTSGDVATTIEGLGKLAPPNSSLRIVSEGTVAAMRGDVMGTAKAVLALAEKQEDLASVTTRLRDVESAVSSARGTVKDARAAIGDVKTTVDDPGGALQRRVLKKAPNTVSR